MLIKILRKDFLRNKSITIALFIFMTLSALLVASGANMITELSNTINALFTQSKAPHFVQMHAGELNQDEIDAFASSNRLVKNNQTVEMIPIDGSHLDLGNGDDTALTSVMDHYFVQQNDAFDLLLNLQSDVIDVKAGEIAVPIYYMQQNDLQLGDTITISNANESFAMTFTIVDFVRDVQMNPSIIHSKRFVVHEADLYQLKDHFGDVEYLIEFHLTDLDQLSEFRNAYQTANLPEQGPNIDYHLFKTLNGITDGIVAVVIIFVSLLLSLIAILCIRFTILTAMEEDYSEIGVMKAIGIPQHDIKSIYLLKYIVLTALAALVGYVFSLFLKQTFTANMMLYIGTAPKSLLQHIVPFIAVGLTFLFVVFSCMLTLRRFHKITAVEALRSGSVGETERHRRYLSLSRSKLFNVHIFLGLRDVFARFKMYRLLFFVFFVCAFIIIVPVNFLTTIQSPHFMTYMGVEQSDIRIDLQQSDDVAKQFDEMITYIENDPDVGQFSPLVTSQFKVLNNDGSYENITVETGDFSIFPLAYLTGVAPVRDNEIALSYLNGKELEKGVGEHLRLIIDGKEQEMVVSGIYQDVTNGGRTAKALLPVNQETVLSHKMSIDVKPHIDLQEKMDEYREAFHPAKVTDLQGYLAQTLGHTIDQLKLVTFLAIVIATCVAILITALFLKMLVAKDDTQIAIMKSIGFSLNQLRTQYVTRALFVLSIGIILGTIMANTLGERLVSLMLSFIGAADITFVIDPVKAYIVCPLTLMIAVTITTLISIASIQKSSIVEMKEQ